MRTHLPPDPGRDSYSKPIPDILSQIKDSYADLRPAERRVADVVLADVAFSVDASNAEIAKRADVSEPTVTRFCRAIDDITGYRTRSLLVVPIATGQRTFGAFELINALAPEVTTRLTAPERLSLLGDEWALVQAGRHQVGEYLTLVSGFRGERTSGILMELNTRLQVIHSYLTTAASRPAFEAFVRNLAQPIIDELGTAAKRGDTDEQRAARAVAISSLGHMGNDREMASQARVALDAALAGRRRLDATAADAIVGLAAAYGDRALHDALLKAAEAAAAPEDRYRYLYALARFTDPALVERGLEHARTPAMRGQDTAGYLNRFLTNPAINHQAWRFVKAHWTELEPKVVVAFGDVTLVNALGSFCDASTRDDIRQFFAGRSLPATTRTLDQTLERITNCIALKESQTPALTDWLRDR